MFLIENESKLLTGYKNRVNSFIYHMVSDTFKFNFEEENKNFSFRPQSPRSKQNIKLRPFVTDKVRIEKFLKTKQIENDIINKNKKKKKYKNLNIENDNTENLEKNMVC